jgi:tRNA-2-methylthio-N6-dimethylallyladenosine synthase
VPATAYFLFHFSFSPVDIWFDGEEKHAGALLILSKDNHKKGHFAALYWLGVVETQQKTFYLETFGCQMNVHDSEKVIGTLLRQGYRQVSTVEEADLVFYNTCSIRDKAEQKVFHRLQDYKRFQAQGKKFAVLGCVAQQEGEKIFAKAPHVSLVAGSASYRNLPQMLVQIESGANRVTGLDDRQTEETFETEFTARSNPHRGYITIIEGCDKFCAYCVVPFTRGKERSRTSESVLAEARQMADQGYTDIQLLGQNVNAYADPLHNKSFAELLAAVGEVPGIRRIRFTTSHPRHFSRDIVEVIDGVPAVCDHVHLPVQSGSSRVLDAMSREYTREMYLEKISWIRSARREIALTTDVIVGFPGETPAEFEETITLLHECQFDGVFSFKYSPRPNTPAITLADATPEDEKSRRLQVLQERQREIQRGNYEKKIGRTIEVMVEGWNEARGQVIGRTSQNITMNFTTRNPVPPAGTYVNVLVTKSFPNSLSGELVV